MSEEKYISPLKDELSMDTDTFGTGIIIAYNKKTKRVFLDIDISERLKISSSGNSILLANGKFNFDSLKGNKQMNVNVWDAQFTKEEMPKVKEFLELKKLQTDQKQALKDLQNV